MDTPGNVPDCQKTPEPNAVVVDGAGDKALPSKNVGKRTAKDTVSASGVVGVASTESPVSPDNGTVGKEYVGKSAAKDTVTIKAVPATINAVPSLRHLDKTTSAAAVPCKRVFSETNNVASAPTTVGDPLFDEAKKRTLSKDTSSKKPTAGSENEPVTKEAALTRPTKTKSSSKSRHRPKMRKQIVRLLVDYSGNKYVCISCGIEERDDKFFRKHIWQDVHSNGHCSHTGSTHGPGMDNADGCPHINNLMQTLFLKKKASNGKGNWQPIVAAKIAAGVLFPAPGSRTEDMMTTGKYGRDHAVAVKAATSRTTERIVETDLATASTTESKLMRAAARAAMSKFDKNTNTNSERGNGEPDDSSDEDYSCGEASEGDTNVVDDSCDESSTSCDEDFALGKSSARNDTSDEDDNISLSKLLSKAAARESTDRSESCLASEVESADESSGKRVTEVTSATGDLDGSPDPAAPEANDEENHDAATSEFSGKSSTSAASEYSTSSAATGTSEEATTTEQGDMKKGASARTIVEGASDPAAPEANDEENHDAAASEFSRKSSTSGTSESSTSSAATESSEEATTTEQSDMKKGASATTIVEGASNSSKSNPDVDKGTLARSECEGSTDSVTSSITAEQLDRPAPDVNKKPVADSPASQQDNVSVMQSSNAPEQTTSSGSAPKQTISSGSAPKQTVSQDNAPKQTASQDNAPKVTASQDNAPKQTTSHGNAPKQATSSGSATKQSASSGNALMCPKQATSSGSAPKQTALGKSGARNDTSDEDDNVSLSKLLSKAAARESTDRSESCLASEVESPDDSSGKRVTEVSSATGDIDGSPDPAAPEANDKENHDAAASEFSWKSSTSATSESSKNSTATGTFEEATTAEQGDMKKGASARTIVEGASNCSMSNPDVDKGTLAHSECEGSADFVTSSVTAEQLDHPAPDVNKKPVADSPASREDNVSVMQSSNAPEQIASSGSAPKQTASQDNAPKQTTSSGSAPKQTTSHGNAPKQGASQDNAPKQGASQDNAPKQTTSSVSAPKQTASHGNAPKQTASQDNAPKQGASSGNAPEQTTSSGNAPKQTISSDSAPKQTASQGNAPKQTASQDNAPKQTISNAPMQTTSSDNAPKQSDGIAGSETIGQTNISNKQSSRPSRQSSEPSKQSPGPTSLQLAARPRRGRPPKITALMTESKEKNGDKGDKDDSEHKSDTEEEGDFFKCRLPSKQSSGSSKQSSRPSSSKQSSRPSMHFSQPTSLQLVARPRRGRPPKTMAIVTKSKEKSGDKGDKDDSGPESVAEEEGDFFKSRLRSRQSSESSKQSPGPSKQSPGPIKQSLGPSKQSSGPNSLQLAARPRRGRPPKCLDNETISANNAVEIQAKSVLKGTTNTQSIDHNKSSAKITALVTKCKDKSGDKGDKDDSGPKSDTEEEGDFFKCRLRSKQSSESSKQSSGPSKQSSQPSKQSSGSSKQSSESSKQSSGPSNQSPGPSKQSSQPSKQSSQPNKQSSGTSKQSSQPSMQSSESSKQSSQPTSLQLAARPKRGRPPKCLDNEAISANNAVQMQAKSVLKGTTNAQSIDHNKSSAKITAMVTKSKESGDKGDKGDSDSESDTEEEGDFFKCRLPMCGQSFSDVAGLRKHIEKSHRSTKLFPCPYCSCLWSNYNRLIEHIPSHVGPKPYRCVQCGVSYKKGASLRKHFEKSHHVDKNFSCTAEDCEFVTNLWTEFKVHVFSYHSEEKGWTCFACDARFPNRDDFIVHAETSMESVICCGLCMLKAKMRHTITRHSASVHSGATNPIFVETTVKCAKTVEQTQPTGTPTKPSDVAPTKSIVLHECRHCDYADRNKASFYKHEEAHGVQKRLQFAFCCELCPFSSSDRTQYKVHLANHRKTPVHQLRCFKCTHCTFATNQMKMIEKHLQEMHKERPFKFEVQQEVVKANSQSKSTNSGVQQSASRAAPQTSEKLQESGKTPKIKSSGKAPKQTASTGNTPKHGASSDNDAKQTASSSNAAKQTASTGSAAKQTASAGNAAKQASSSVKALKLTAREKDLVSSPVPNTKQAIAKRRGKTNRSCSDDVDDNSDCPVEKRSKIAKKPELENPASTDTRRRMSRVKRTASVDSIVCVYSEADETGDDKAPPTPAVGAVENSSAAVEGSGAAVESNGAAVESSGAAGESNGAAVESSGTAGESNGAAVESSSAAVESNSAAVESSSAAVESSSAAVESSSPAVESSSPAVGRFHCEQDSCQFLCDDWQLFHDHVQSLHGNCTQWSNIGLTVTSAADGKDEPVNEADVLSIKDESTSNADAVEVKDEPVNAVDDEPASTADENTNTILDDDTVDAKPAAVQGEQTCHCDLCSTVCEEFESFKTHMGAVHSFKVVRTEDGFPDQIIMACPIESPPPESTEPSGGDPLRCKNCPFTSKSKDNMAAHNLKHSSKPKTGFKCMYCSYSASRRFIVARHALLYHPDRPKGIGQSHVVALQSRKTPTICLKTAKSLSKTSQKSVVSDNQVGGTSDVADQEESGGDPEEIKVGSSYSLSRLGQIHIGIYTDLLFLQI